MEHYKKGEVKECPQIIDLPTIHPNALEMTLKSGSKVRNLLGPALKYLSEDGPHKQVVWRGNSKTLNKAISCAEIIKQRCPHVLHQITRIFYKRIEEYYEPILPNLERLRVVREVPAIVIILSREPAVDAGNGLLGYQNSGTSIEKLCDVGPASTKSALLKSRGSKQKVHPTKSKRQKNVESRLELSLKDL